MSPLQTPKHVQGLHVLAVVKAARELSSVVTRSGGAARVQADAIRETLGELVTATDRLTNFERQAIARGELPVDTASADVADILARAAGLLNADREQHDAMNLTDEEAAAVFELDADAAPQTEPSPPPDLDDLSAFDSE